MRFWIRRDETGYTVRAKELETNLNQFTYKGQLVETVEGECCTIP